MIYLERDIPESDGYDPKEVFAFFGLTAYNAQVLEKGLVNLALGLHLSGRLPIKHPTFDELLSYLDHKTLGQILRLARQVVDIPATLEQQLQLALKQRNHLSHHFFAVHFEDFISEAGRREMIAELRSIAEHLQATDRLLDTVTLSLFHRLGLTGENLDAEFRRLESKALQRDAV